MFRAIFKRELFGFDEQVRVVGASKTHALDLVSLEDVEHLQHGDALPVRRQFPYLISAIARRDWIDPIRLVLGEVLRREKAAVFLHERGNRLRHSALVKTVTAFFGDCFQSTAETSIDEDL